MMPRMDLRASVHNVREMAFWVRALKSMFPRDPARFVLSVKVARQKHFILDVGNTGGVGSKSGLFLTMKEKDKAAMAGWTGGNPESGGTKVDKQIVEKAQQRITGTIIEGRDTNLHF